MSGSSRIFMALMAAVASAAVGVSLANDEHHTQAEAAKAPVAAPAPAGAEVTANMEKMRAQMAAIHGTSDPAARAKLLQEHMQTMQATMQTMQNGGGCTMMGTGTSGASATGGMGMMQMMMDQMMQHQNAMQGMGKK